MVTMPPRVLGTMITTTSYGSWMPGDVRGYVDSGTVLPANPNLLKHAHGSLANAPVRFTDVQQIVLFHALRNAAVEFGYQLLDVSVESWHLHWIVDHGFDPVKTMAGRLKTRMRQFINRGRIWTKGYCHRCLYTPNEIEVASQYIARHAGCRMTARSVIERHRERTRWDTPRRV
jgi:hypothetical protein